MRLNARSLLGLLPILAILGAFWFVLIAPTRADVTAAEAQIAQANARRDAAVATAAQAQQARVRYPRDYASVARLAQAVPVEEDVAALVRGLDSLARASKLDFRTIALTAAVAKEPEAAPPASGDEAGGKAEGDDKAESAPPAEAPAAGDPPAAAPGAAGTDGAVAQAPPGAAVGEAGLLTMPFTFTAEGSYLPLQRFLRSLHARAKGTGERVRVNGRLLTIDGLSFVAGRKGFPQISAIVSATAYLEPDPGGVLDRSTRRAPAIAIAAPVAPTTPPPVQGAAG